MQIVQKLARWVLPLRWVRRLPPLTTWVCLPLADHWPCAGLQGFEAVASGG